MVAVAVQTGQPPCVCGVSQDFQGGQICDGSSLLNTRGRFFSADCVEQLTCLPASTYTCARVRAHLCGHVRAHRPAGGRGDKREVGDLGPRHSLISVSELGTKSLLSLQRAVRTVLFLTSAGDSPLFIWRCPISSAGRARAVGGCWLARGLPLSAPGPAGSRPEGWPVALSPSASPKRG